MSCTLRDFVTDLKQLDRGYMSACHIELTNGITKVETAEDLAEDQLTLYYFIEDGDWKKAKAPESYFNKC